MKIKVRKIKEQDYEVVGKIHNKAFSCIGQTKESFQDSFTSHTTWVAVSGNKVIGYIQSKNKKTTVYCTWFAVDKKFRQCGAGKRLLRALMRHTKKTKAKKIQLETRNRFKPAIYFYLQNDFDIIGTRVGLDSDTMILLEYQFKK
ncbi:MAG: GNAT family N-acetyltransferase [Bdellovibrionales bacterium]|nr:GNAT family N-acetyltransferase [Bdellovibrionales bacterium]